MFSEKEELGQLLFSPSAVSDSLRPHGLQYVRLPCPSLSPRVCWEPRIHWVNDAIQPSHPLLPSSPFAFNISQHQGLFQSMGWLFTSGQSIGASALASVLPMNIQAWFPLGLTGLISLQSKGLSRVFSSTTIWKHQFFILQPSLWSQGSNLCFLHLLHWQADSLTLSQLGSIPGSGRSLGGRHGNPLQYSCLENPMDRGAWQAAVHRVVKELDTTEQLNNGESDMSKVT